MNTISIWQSITKNKPNFPQLNRSIEADVVVIGAGITGLTTAMLLHEAGKNVVVVDAGEIGGGTTSWSTGNLYVAIQQYYRGLKKKQSDYVLTIVAKSRQSAIEFIEQQVREKQIDCDFHRRPWFLYTNQKDKVVDVEEEVKKLRDAGMTINVTEDLQLPVPHLIAARMDNQARMNPYQYVLGIADSLLSKGCPIYAHTLVTDIDRQNDRVLVKTSTGFEIDASKVVMATHIPKGFNPVQTVAAPYRSYVVGVKLRNGIYPDGNFWDMADPHHATSTHSDNGKDLNVLLVAGNHHKTGQADNNDHRQHYRQIEAYINKHYDVQDVVYRWSAQHYHSGDGLPYIGYAELTNNRVLMATGFYADGLVWGTVAARVMADLLLERENQFTKTFDARRFSPVASAGEFVKENINVGKQYIKDFIFKRRSDETDSVKAGEGKVLQIDGHKVAVHRDQQQQLHIVSAICTHLGCVVHWNNAEETWDCPCHGSRFRTDGSVIEGPAYNGLEKYTVEKE